MDPTQFTPEQLMQKGSKIWKHLDELAATDPEFSCLTPCHTHKKIAYKQFIKSATENATQNPVQSHIKPGFRIETKEASSDLSRVYHVNFAVTDKLAAPPANDPLNIPICISEIRTGEDKKSKVVDAIINPAVLEKCNKDSFFKSDLINLVIDCIEETHKIKLSKRTNKIIDNEYKGPFGWDEKGRPLSDADISKMNNVKVVAESAEEHGIDTLKLPTTHSSIELKAQPPGEVSVKPVIEVIDDGSCCDTKDATWTEKTTATHRTLYCNLPNIKSQAEIAIKLVGQSLDISTATHKLSIQVSNLKSVNQCEAKFIRSSRVLKVKIPTNALVE